MQPSSSAKLFLGATLVLTLVLVAVAVFLIRSPSEMKLVRLDEMRVLHLQRISNEIGKYLRATDNLPDTLSDLQTRDDRVVLSADPVSGKSYSFRKISDLEYELCATFDLPDLEPGRTIYANRDWRHPAGAYCFSKKLKRDAK